MHGSGNVLVAFAAMDVTRRFADLVEGPAETLPLDEALLLVAAHDHDVDVPAQRARLDDLAAACDQASLTSVLALLFEDAGVRGDEVDYHHPDNSFLDRVLDRRRGLPILLSVLTAEVAARCGVCLAPVGLPGHFLLRDCADDGVFVDPFNRGRLIDQDECEAMFHRLHPGQSFQPSFLDPVDSKAVVTRVLTNLVRTYVQRGPVGSLAWAAHLRALLVGGDSWRVAARLRERTGDWALAAEAWEGLGDAAAAAAARARAN
jgi:regulator of sirC expression with transglutaminase-like and TPR domain